MDAAINASYEESIRELGFDLVNWKIQVAVLFIMFILGFAGNMIVLVMLLRKRLAVSSAIRHLILNLVIADLFVAVFCILTLAIWHYSIQWLAGDFMCRLSKYMQMFSLYASTYIILVISLDRCISIASPISGMGKQKVIQRLVISAWLLASIFSIPQAIIFKVERAPLMVDFYQCVTFGSYTAAWQEPVYTIFTLFVNFIIPLVIIIMCYATILYKLFTGGRLVSVTSSQKNTISGFKEFSSLNAAKTCGHHAQSNGWNASLTVRYAKLRKARTTSLWISVLIVMAFLICWGPYYVRMGGAFLEMWGQSTDENFEKFVFFYGMSNSVINPLIYGAFHILGKSRRSRNTLHQKDSHPGKVPDRIQQHFLQTGNNQTQLKTRITTVV